MPDNAKVAQLFERFDLTMRNARSRLSNGRVYKDGEVRRFDGKTPSVVHSGGMCLEVLQEVRLPHNTRVLLHYLCLSHDTFEDATTGRRRLYSEELRLLLGELGEAVIYLTRMSSFQDSAHEFSLLHARPPLVKLAKLYDKVSNLRDWCPNTGDQYKMARYLSMTEELARYVECHYGRLNKVGEARGLCELLRNEYQIFEHVQVQL